MTGRRPTLRGVVTDRLPPRRAAPRTALSRRRRSRTDPGPAVPRCRQYQPRAGARPHPSFLEHILARALDRAAADLERARARCAQAALDLRGVGLDHADVGQWHAERSDYELSVGGLVPLSL